MRDRVLYRMLAVLLVCICLNRASLSLRSSSEDAVFTVVVMLGVFTAFASTGSSSLFVIDVIRLDGMWFIG